MLNIIKREEGICENYVNDKEDRPPLMKPPASYRGLNTPGGVQIDSHTATGYKNIGNKITIAAEQRPAPASSLPNTRNKMEATISRFEAVRSNSEKYGMIGIVKAIVNEPLTYVADGVTRETTRVLLSQEFCEENVGCSAVSVGPDAFHDARLLACDLNKELKGKTIEVVDVEEPSENGAVYHHWYATKLL